MLDEYRSMIEEMGTGAAWTGEDDLVEIEAVDDGADEGVVALLAEERKRIEADGIEAVDLLMELLSAAPAEWSSHIAENPRLRQPGVVRKLLELTREHFDKSPTRGFELTVLATEIAGKLSAGKLEHDRLRAAAWRERGLALTDVSRYADALAAFNEAERHTDRLPDSDLEVAMVDYGRANALRQMQRIDEALASLRSAQRVFARYGSSDLLLKSKYLEAMTIFRAKRYEEPLAILESIAGAVFETQSISMGAMLQTNIANCLYFLGRHAEAETQFEQAMRGFNDCGLLAFAARAAWGLARVAIANGANAVGAERLRNVRSEFDALGMTAEWILAGIDLVTAIFGTPEESDIPAICRSIASRAERLNMRQEFRIATAYIRETATRGRLTPEIAQYTRIYLEDAPIYPNLPFDPPPAS